MDYIAAGNVMSDIIEQEDGTWAVGNAEWH